LIFSLASKNIDVPPSISLFYHLKKSDYMKIFFSIEPITTVVFPLTGKRGDGYSSPLWQLSSLLIFN
ncbi:hypothetical protein, partial [Priestia megaterium]|uniref:hypothetical protein n=1 Tax=Priestia megaterium TaxID=1404 RepID=UPI00300018C9